MGVLLFAALIVLTSPLAAEAQTPSEPAGEQAALPAGPGRDLVIRVCSECHSTKVAVEQQLDLEGWTRVVDLMASQGALATDAELEEIVRYLAKAFPASG